MDMNFILASIGVFLVTSGVGNYPVGSQELPGSFR